MATTAQDSFTFTVGKLDAGMAILLGERAHLIEFPSILLPPGASTGSIVNISVSQNHTEEKKRENEFWQLQDGIMEEFGRELPQTPELKIRNVTQTSVTLEWPAVQLATSKLRSLDLYRNGQRLVAIPSPTTNLSTKVSGLDLATEYTFQLVLRTTAGTFPSPLLRVRTHSMTDTSGIRACFGTVQDEGLLNDSKLALEELGGKWSDRIEIDTTHFICTTPAAVDAAGQGTSAPGVLYQRALQLSIPILQPQWILSCHARKTMVPVAAFYLGADSSASASTPAFRPQSMSQANIHATKSPTSPTNNRMSMPVTSAARSPPAQDSPTTPNSPFVNGSGSTPPTQSKQPETVPEGVEGADEDPDGPGAGGRGEERSARSPSPSEEKARKRRSGTMNKDFKFPASSSPSGSPVVAPPVPAISLSQDEKDTTKPLQSAQIQVPPPPPVEKERNQNPGVSSDGDVEEEVGPTEEISLN